MEADRPCTVDLVRQVSVCTGNVVIAQGTLVIRADRVELRETPEGYRTATAIGTPGKPAVYRQKRDGGDEQVEGSADRVEYDARADTLRFIGSAQVRRLRGTVASEEIQGAVIVWDNAAELFSVQGGAATPSNPGGRVRAVLSPRPRRPPPRPPVHRAAHPCGPARRSASGVERAARDAATATRPAEASPSAAASRGAAARVVAPRRASRAGSKPPVCRRPTARARSSAKCIWRWAPAKWWACSGPNGAGKTTTFYMVVGLVRADAGEIRIDGQPVHEQADPPARAARACRTCRRRRRSFAS